MTTEEISKILKLHKAWINGEKHGKRANLSEADLSRANLSGPKMCHIRLWHARTKESLPGGKNAKVIES